MLRQLVEIKRQRERSLRNTLAKLVEELASLEAREQQLRARKEKVFEEWRALSQEEGCLDHNALSLLRGAILIVENEAKRLVHDIDSLEKEKKRLENLRSDQEKLISANLLEQEKLHLLDDKDDNFY